MYGDRCDKCKPGTYGYDQVVGCRPCKCDNLGTKNANQTCDVTTGQCVCNENFDGRQCSECRAGYFGKPVCRKCSCNPRGVTEKKCSRDTGRCLCKVGGRAVSVISLRDCAVRTKSMQLFFLVYGVLIDNSSFLVFSPQTLLRSDFQSISKHSRNFGEIMQEF